MTYNGVTFKLHNSIWDGIVLAVCTQKNFNFCFGGTPDEATARAKRLIDVRKGV